MGTKCKSGKARNARSESVIGENRVNYIIEGRDNKAHTGDFWLSEGKIINTVLDNKLCFRGRGFVRKVIDKKRNTWTINWSFIGSTMFLTRVYKPQAQMDS